MPDAGRSTTRSCPTWPHHRVQPNRFDIDDLPDDVHDLLLLTFAFCEGVDSRSRASRDHGCPTAVPPTSRWSLNRRSDRAALIVTLHRPAGDTVPSMDTATFAQRSRLRGSTAHRYLTPPFEGDGTLEARMAQYRRSRTHCGMPTSAGSGMARSGRRAASSDDVRRSSVGDRRSSSSPTPASGRWSRFRSDVASFGSPELVAEIVPLLLRGDELWC